MDPHAAAIIANLGGDPGQILKSADELRPAVGVAGIIKRIDTDKQVPGPGGFSPGKCERQKYKIACRDIGHRDICPYTVLGHVNVSCQCRSAELAQIERQNHVPFDSEGLCDLPRCINLNPMALVVIYGQCKNAKTLFMRKSRTDHRIEAARKQDNCKWGCTGTDMLHHQPALIVRSASGNALCRITMCTIQRGALRLGR